MRVAATTSKFPKPTRVGWVASGAHQVGRGEDGGGRDQADVEVDSWVGVRAQRCSKVDAGSVRSREAVRRPGISNRSSSLYAPDMMSDE